MPKKNLFWLSLIIVLGGIAYYYWGNLLSLLLITVVLGSFWYFFRILHAESYVNSDQYLSLFADKTKWSPKKINQQKRITFHRHRILAAATFLIGIFLISILVLKYYLLPPEEKPYFNNTDYTAMSNSGVAFGNHIILYTDQEDQTHDGLFSSDHGELTLSVSNQKGNLKSDQFFTPIFIQKENHYLVQNNSLSQPLVDGYSISNDLYNLTFYKVRQSKTWYGSKENNTYELGVQIDDKKLGKKDTLELLPTHISKGINMFDLFVRAKEKHIKYSTPNAILRLQNCLLLLRQSLLLANQNAEGTYLTFFPSQDFLTNHFQASVSNNIIPLHTKIDIPLEPNTPFYVGLVNSIYKYKWNFEKLPDGSEKPILVFDYKNYKPLSTALIKSSIGFKQARFLVNHYSQIHSQGIQEGFLFHDNLRRSQSNFINGTLDYTVDRPGIPLQANYVDYNAGSSPTSVNNGQFVLQSDNGQYLWVIQLQNFANNGFSMTPVFWYLSILMLAFIALLVFQCNIHLTRIEPIIFAVLYCLIFYRFILLWRVATFPPLSGISMHEFRTLIDFDYNLLGISLPLPLTFVVPLLFTVLIFVFRSQKKKATADRKDLSELLIGQFQKIKMPIIRSLTDRFIKASPLTRDIILYYLLGLFVYKMIELVHMDFLIRIMGIIYPLAIYFYLSRKYYHVDEGTPTFLHRNKIVNYIQRFIYYMQSNPVFYVALATIGFLFITDRGFAIIFMLFLLFKSFIFNLVITPFNGSWRSMLFNPKNYWIYGFLSLILYLMFIGIRPMFYYIIEYKVWILALLVGVTALYLYFLDFSKYKNIIIGLSVLFIFLVLPKTNQWLDSQINHQLKHVIYRAYIIDQPIEKLIYKSKASSFEEKKIYETAENQWFINSYLSKHYDNNERINLRPHFNSGVNYSTQTRDVVLPRYVISEHGPVVMIVLLVLLVIPFLFYLISYGIKDKNTKTILNENAVVGMALILVFTIGFFVWLTSTNRFVFFGQDFPFLSLTSKVSMLITLSILWFVYFGKPKENNIRNLQVKLSMTRNSIFTSIILLVIIISGRSNILSSTNFNANLDETEKAIDDKLDLILYELQSRTGATAAPNPRQALTQKLPSILDSLKVSKAYQDLYQQSTVYTRSVMDILTHTPTVALTTTSPIYLRYDNGRYTVEYNKHLHLELPAYDNRLAWKGDMVQSGVHEQELEYPNVQFGNEIKNTDQKITRKYTNQCGLIVLPNTWFMPDEGPIGLISLHNSNHGNRTTFIQIHNSRKGTTFFHDMQGYVTQLHYHDVAMVYDQDNKSTIVSLTPSTQKLFMANYWVNGRQKMIYPLGDKFFYAYHFTHAMKDLHTAPDELSEDVKTTLDYQMQNNIHDIINAHMKTYGIDHPNFKMSVIAANGNGDITFMSDYVKNRRLLDPNDDNSIDNLKQDQYFFSVNSSERNQWGDVNLLHMGYGPGSSIKPALISAVASQLNAGWENLIMLQSPLFQNSASYKLPSVGQYAGLRLPNYLRWEEEHSGDNSNTDISKYIITSSNLYNSIIMFLGSYNKANFEKSNSYSLANVLTKDNDNGRASYPIVNYQGQTYYLQSLNNKAWPKARQNSKEYFTSENSLVADGLNYNYGIIVDDEDKFDYSLKTQMKINFTNADYFDTLKNQTTSVAVWSFPEPSYFIQNDRGSKDKITNFLMGLKNPTLGGAPYYITPLKMAEVYGSLVSQNNLYRLHITPRPLNSQTWNVDTTWHGKEYQNFLKKYIYPAMGGVIQSGTASALRSMLGGNTYKGYHLYAKTGTIGSGNRNSKRFALIISQNPLETTDLSTNKFYILYFTENEIKGASNNWSLYKDIIDELMNSNTFKNYMK